MFVISGEMWSFKILVLIGILVLFPFAYFISVLIERWVVTKFFDKQYEQEAISQAVKSANKASYIFLFSVYMLVIAVYSLKTYTILQKRQNDMQNIKEVA
jgi:hypothetical protein